MLKKILLIFSVLLLLFSFCSCKKTDDDVSNQTTEAPSENSEVKSEEAAAAPVITGKLYAVVNEEILTNNFSFSGGAATPERIAAGLSGWSGLKLGITSETDETTKTITISFKPDSSVATDNYKGNGRFTFNSADEMKQFVKDSLKESIKQNIGEYELIFMLNGEQI